MNHPITVRGDRCTKKPAVQQFARQSLPKRPILTTASFWATVVLFALTVVGCSGTNKGSPATKKSPQKIAAVMTAAVLKGEMTRAISLNGTIEPDRLARLASPAEGPVLQLSAREGDAVSGGKTLLRIGRKSGVDALIGALAEDLRKEQDNLDRTQRLVAGKALPGEELDKAKASFEKVKSQLASAQQSAQDYRITAPFSGLVSRLLVSEGDFVAPRAPLVEIYDPATMVLRATVSERYAAMLKIDMPADILLDAYPKKTFSGRISRLFPSLDERTRARTIELKIDQPVDLLPGMFARIKLVVESIPDALTVPVNALLVTPRGAAVVFVVQDAKAVQRQVTIGIEDSDHLQILAGVSVGEQVVISGHEKLKDGAAVRLLGAKASKKEPKAGPTFNRNTPKKAHSDTP